jgi:hypothetical protein
MAMLRLVINNKSSYSTQGQDTSASVMIERSIKIYEESLQKFRSKILNTNLIQSLCQDDGAYFKIKGMVNTLNNSSESANNNNLLRFLVEFELLLEMIARSLQKKKEHNEEANKEGVLQHRKN